MKPDTKRCKPHGTPSTWTLEDQEFYMSFSLADSHSYPGKGILTNRFFQCHTRNIPALNNTARWHWDIQGTAWQLFEIWVLQGKAAGQGRARQGKALYAALLLSTLPYWILYSSLLYAALLYSTLLFPTDLSTLLFSTLLFSFHKKTTASQDTTLTQ